MSQIQTRRSTLSSRYLQTRRASEWIRSTFTPTLTRLRVVLVLAGIELLSITPAMSQQKPIPDEAAQNAALALVNEAYKSDYDAAKTDEQKVALARKMLQQGAAMRNDPAGHYVLFRTASELAGKAGDVQLALQTIAEVQKAYQVDALSLKATAIADAAKTLRTPEEQQRIITPTSPLIGEAIARDDYELAKTLSAIAIASARKAKDTAVIKRFAQSNEEVAALRIRLHAVHWYKKAVPSLSGLTKVKIEKRIDDAAATELLFVLREVTAYKAFRLVPESVERHVLAPGTANAVPMIEGGQVASPLKNFLDGMSGWKCEGDVSEFRIIDNGAGIFTYGSTKREAARGRLSQTFVVPNDASKLRFEVRGGRAQHIFVALKSDGAELKRATGRNSNTPHVLEWEIQTLRGKTVEFEIVDRTNGPWQFIGVSKIEVVRADQ